MLVAPAIDLIVSRKAARLLHALHRAPLDYLRAFGAATRPAKRERRTKREEVYHCIAALLPGEEQMSFTRRLALSHRARA